MSKDGEKKKGSDECPEAGVEREVTRRRFMKSVGLAGAAVGLGSLAAGKKALGQEGGEKNTGAKKAGKKLKLKVAFSENPRVLPLKEGVVSPEHIELEFETISPDKLFWRNLSQGLTSDASEMSISETLLA